MKVELATAHARVFWMRGGARRCGEGGCDLGATSGLKHRQEEGALGAKDAFPVGRADVLGCRPPTK